MNKPQASAPLNGRRILLTRAKHDDGDIHEGTPGGTVKDPPAKGVEHPSKAHKIGIVCIDAAIAAPDQGVCDS